MNDCTLLIEIREALGTARQELATCAAGNKREAALVRTKLEEALMWAERFAAAEAEVAEESPAK